MKRVSLIRQGLRSIDGALQDFPPDDSYEGSEDAVPSTRPLWVGEDVLDATIAPPPPDDGTDADEEPFGREGGGHSFEPVFEFGADAEDVIRGMGGDAGKEIEQSVLVRGVDALGWYVSFHYTGTQWGIYVPVSGIAYLAVRVFHGLRVPLATKIHLAFQAIFNHELFHFATDYAIAQAELTHREPWFLPARRVFRSGSPSYCVQEEQLANAYMLAAFRSMTPAMRVRGKQAALQSFVRMQPEGYRDALGVRPQDVDFLLVDLAHQFGQHAAKSRAHPLLWGSGGFDWSQQFPIRPRIDWKYCPIHLVDDSTRYGLPTGWLSFFSRLSDIQESEDFQAMFHRLAPPLQRAWERTKHRLQSAITRGADFKKWDKGGADCYSVRINGGFRAHLVRREDRNDWLAVAIGSHKKMGHG